MKRCKARGRVSKKPCGNPPVTGREVCRMHGGATPRGTASPHYKHGLYSRYAAPALAARIAELREDEERLHDLREVLAVQGALLGEALAQGNLPAAAALSEAVSRSIDRYHKHNPPETSPSVIKFYSGLPERDSMTLEEIEERINELLAKAQERDQSAVYLPVSFAHIGNPMQGEEDGNP